MKLCPTCQCKGALMVEMADYYVTLEIAWLWSVQEKNPSQQIKYFETCTELYRHFQVLQATKHKRDCVRDKHNSRFGYKLPNPVRKTKKCFCHIKQSLIVSASQRRKFYDIEKADIQKELLQLGSDLTHERDAKKKKSIQNEISVLQRRDEEVNRMSVMQIVIDPAVFDAASFHCATETKNGTSTKSVWNMFAFETGYHPPSGY